MRMTNQEWIALKQLANRFKLSRPALIRWFVASYDQQIGVPLDLPKPAERQQKT